MIGYTISLGEFYLHFKIFSDVEINGVPYITLDRLKRFYADGYALFREISEATNLKEQKPETTISSSFQSLSQNSRCVIL